MFREFKRQYHKARHAHDALRASGPITFRIGYKEDEGLQAEHKTPNDEEAVRFTVLMHPFLNPSSPLYFKKQWSTLQEQFGAELPSERIAIIEKEIEDISQGFIRLEVYGSDLTAESVYQILSDGEYFDEDKEAQEKLKSLTNLPIIGTLFLHQFYDYSLSVFQLLSVIFDVVRSIEVTETYRKLYGQAQASLNKCIYCLTTEASFKSEEHILPESLGNDDAVLPKGFVCDKCNNEILSLLDNALLQFEPIAFLQVQFVPHTKGGKLPQANFRDVTVKKDKPRQITLISKDGKEHISRKQELEDGRVLYTFTGTLKKFEPKLLGRAIYKIALGMVAFSKGHEEACGSRYDAARDFILGRQDFQNYISICFDSKPHSSLRVIHTPAPEGTPYFIDIFGLYFIVNLEPTPLLRLDEELTKANFRLFPLFDAPSLCENGMIQDK